MCCTGSSYSNLAGTTPSRSPQSLHLDTQRRMWRRARIWKWAALHKLMMWSSKNSVLSMVTPRLYCSCDRSTDRRLWHLLFVVPSFVLRWCRLRLLQIYLHSDNGRWGPTSDERTGNSHWWRCCRVLQQIAQQNSDSGCISLQLVAETLKADWSICVDVQSLWSVVCNVCE